MLKSYVLTIDVLQQQYDIVWKLQYEVKET